MQSRIESGPFMLSTVVNRAAAAAAAAAGTAPLQATASSICQIEVTRQDCR